jgi:hypothetical protein
MNSFKITLYRSLISINLFGGLIFIWFLGFFILFVFFTPSNVSKFGFVVGIIFILFMVVLGFLMLTSPTRLYIDINQKAIIQKGRFLIFISTSEDDIFIELKNVKSIKVKIESLIHGCRYTPIIYDYEKNKYELISTQRRYVVFKIVEIIKRAVLEETGKEPQIYLPTKEQIKRLT